MDVWGKFESVAALRNGMNLVTVKQGVASVTIRGLSGAERHPALSILHPGDDIGVFNVKCSSPGSFQETPRTAIYKMC